MKKLSWILMFVGTIIWAQKLKQFPIDSSKLANIDTMIVDEYGAIYLHNEKNFSLTKLDSLGKIVGRLQLTIPFQVQPVTNPMQVVLFSEQAQQVKVFDAYLTEKQHINLGKFGYIKEAFFEDQQILWLLDEANRTMIQYNYQIDKVISSTPFFIDLQNISDFIYFENHFYLLNGNTLEIYNSRFEKIKYFSMEAPYRIRRENEQIFIFDKNKLWSLDNQNLNIVKSYSDSVLVDKNSAFFYESSQGKLYIYTL